MSLSLKTMLSEAECLLIDLRGFLRQTSDLQSVSMVPSLKLGSYDQGSKSEVITNFESDLGLAILAKICLELT